MTRRRRNHHGVVKRYHPPGTSPGTLVPSETAASPVKLSLVVYSAEMVQEHTIGSLADAQALLPEGAQGWLRIVGHDAAVLDALQHWGVHPLVLEDVLNVGQRPKLEDYGSYLFLVVDVLRGGAPAIEEEQVSLLLFERLLITVQERESDLFALVEARVRSNQGKMRRMGVDYLAYALVDAAVDHFFPLLERIGERIEDEESALLDRGRVATPQPLHAIRRDLLRARKTTWPLRDMVAGLSRIESPLVRDATRVWLRDVHDHTVQLIDIVETFRDMTASLIDLYMSAVSNRLNEVMKILTIIATIFIPLTFIVGVYGMNFDPDASRWNMPELRWVWGYPAVWLVMLAVTAGMVLMFRRRGWF